VHPLTSACAAARLDLSTVDAATASLAVGWYVIRLAGLTGLAFGKMAGAATVPASGAAESSGEFVLGDGDTLHVTTAGALHVILSAGTGTLGLTHLP
jgi:hypothetical protein